MYSYAAFDMLKLSVEYVGTLQPQTHRFYPFFELLAHPIPATETACRARASLKERS